MKAKNLFLFICLCWFILISLSGCSTITTGNSQSVTVTTDPAGATCTLSRNGTSLAVINPTPGTVTVDKSRSDIAVICKREGYQDGAGVFDSQFQGMTFGNILFGGLIGLAIDAGSGAINRYPAMLNVVMVPSEFRSSADANVFFDKMKADCIAENQKKVEQVAALCSNGTDENGKEACAMQKKALDEEKEKNLAEIERKRVAARIRS